MSKKKLRVNPAQFQTSGDAPLDTPVLEDDEVVSEEIEETEDEEVEEEVTESEEENIEEKVTEESEDTPQVLPVYRVRMDWNDPRTQIFANVDIKLCEEFAKKHDGYKVYDEDGNVVLDPWPIVQDAPELIKKEPEKPVAKEDIKIGELSIGSVALPSEGTRLVLTKTPIYRFATSKFPFAYMSGEFFYYDSSISNGRAKITKFGGCCTEKSPSMILGYIDIKRGG